MSSRLKIDKDAFSASERLISNELGNSILASTLRLQQHFGLRAEVFQVFLVIVLATVQKGPARARSGRHCQRQLPAAARPARWHLASPDRRGVGHPTRNRPPPHRAASAR
jgi:hypothetical protein